MDLMVKVSDEHYLVTMSITWLPRRTLLGYHEHYLVTTTSITWLPWALLGYWCVWQEITLWTTKDF